MAFTSDEGRFGARFPSAPQSEVMPTATAVGNVDQKMFSASEGDVFYAASFADYPADIMKDSDSAAVLDGARDGAVSNVNGTLIHEKQITLDGHPGRDIRIQATAEGLTMSMDARIYLVDNRLYQIIVVRPGTASDDPTTTRFLNSFHLSP